MDKEQRTYILVFAAWPALVGGLVFMAVAAIAHYM